MIIHGDAIDVLDTLDSDSIDMVFSSPSPFPYDEEVGIGSEPTEEDYIDNLYELFNNKIKRVLKPSGSMYIQLADYHDDSGSMRCIPEKFMLLMQQQGGWLVRSKPIWIRTEKFTFMEDYNRYTRDWEPLLFFTRSREQYFNNPRQKIVSAVNYHPYHQPRDNYYESGFPADLIQKSIHYSCPTGGTVLDPLAGSGITGIIAQRMKRKYILIEINEGKAEAIKERLDQERRQSY